MTFDEFINNPTSEKICLTWLFPRTRFLTGWTTYSSWYVRDVDYFINKVIVDKVELSQVFTNSLTTNQFFYDSNLNKLYVRLTGSNNPKDYNTIIEYKLFYANAPVILPHDLDSGRDVEYISSISDISSFSHEIDSDDLTGISLTGSGSISFITNDSSFDDIYDKLFWELSKIEIYLYSPDIEAVDSQLIYRGNIDSKTFDKSKVTFRVKDAIEQLRNEIPLDLFTDEDGVLPESMFLKAKRRIYGQVDKLKLVSLDQTLDSFNVGSFEGTSISKTLTTNITNIRQTVFPKDIVVFYNSTTENFDEREVSSCGTLASNYEINITDALGFDTDGPLDFSIRPYLPSRWKNRNWYIATHALKTPSTTITEFRDDIRFYVADPTDFFEDDTIYVGSDPKIIRRISGNLIVLNTILSPVPSIGTTVSKLPVTNVRHENKLLVIDRDYTISNLPTISKLVLTNTLYTNNAELNLAYDREAAGTFTFTLGSHTVTSTASIIGKIKEKDWIKPKLTTQFFEVHRIVDDNTLELVLTFFGSSSYTTTIDHRVPEYIDEKSNITITTLGKTEDSTPIGVWIRTGAQVVKDLLEEQSIEINTDSFDAASLECSYLISLKLPFDYLGKRPVLKDVIERINKSIFGSLHLNANYEIVYNVLTPKKPPQSTILRDDDIIDYSVESTGKNIVKTVTANYAFADYDPAILDKSSLSMMIENDFINNISAIERLEEIDVYLYNESKVRIIMQRISLLREFANLILTLETKMNFHNKSLGDPVYFELDRLFHRFSTLDDKVMIGVINRISKDFNQAQIEITNLSSLYNKICTITPDDANIYSDSDKKERALNGFITATNGVINDLEHTYRNNLIG